MSYNVQDGLDPIKEKIEDLFTSKFDNLSTEEINHAKEENNVDEEFEPSSTTNSDYKQKRFALKSTEFNLKSRFFNEL